MISPRLIRQIAPHVWEFTQDELDVLGLHPGDQLGSGTVRLRDSEVRCEAQYDPYGNKQCTLSIGHDGHHLASWQQQMTFERDYRDSVDFD